MACINWDIHKWLILFLITSLEMQKLEIFVASRMTFLQLLLYKYKGYKFCGLASWSCMTFWLLIVDQIYGKDTDLLYFDLCSWLYMKLENPCMIPSRGLIYVKLKSILLQYYINKSIFYILVVWFTSKKYNRSVSTGTLLGLFLS